MPLSDIMAGRAVVLISAVDTTGRILDRVQARMAAFGMRMTAIGAAAMAPFVSSMSSGTAFDDQIRMLEAVTNAADETAEALARLKKQAMEEGPRMGIDPLDVAKTQTELGKAGFKRDEIRQMTPAVLRMARSSDSDPIQSGEILGSTLRQFGMGADQAARVADVLAMTVNRSAISLTELGDSMKYIGPLAKGLGMSLEETSALIGVLGNLGIKGEQAGTALRAIEIRAASMGDKFEESGIKTRDAVGNLLHPVQILQNMLKVMEGMGTGDRAALFAKLFGMRGMLGAVPINENALVDIKAFEQALQQAAGSAEANAAILDGGVGGALRRVKAEFQALKITVSEALTPMFQGFLSNANKFVKWMQEVVIANPRMVKELALTSITITGIGIALTALAATISLITTPVGAVTAAIALLGASAVSSYMDFDKSIGAIVARIEKGDMVGAFEEAIAQMRVALGLLLDEMTGLAVMNRLLDIGPQGDPEGFKKRLEWEAKERARVRDEAMANQAAGDALGQFGMGVAVRAAGGKAVAAPPSVQPIVGAIREGFALGVPEQAKATSRALYGLIDAVESGTVEAARRVVENRTNQLAEIAGSAKVTAEGVQDAGDELRRLNDKADDILRKLDVD